LKYAFRSILLVLCNWMCKHCIYYFNFFLEVASIGFAASEFAVADTFIFSFLGFLDSLFPRLLLPLPMVRPSIMQRSLFGIATVIH
jgi:hypothetical protein